jgi:hypothetical protein
MLATTQHLQWPHTVLLNGENSARTASQAIATLRAAQDVLSQQQLDQQVLRTSLTLLQSVGCAVPVCLETTVFSAVPNCAAVRRCHSEGAVSTACTCSSVRQWQ